MSFFKVPRAKKVWNPDPLANPYSQIAPVVYAGTAIYAHSKGQMTQAQLDAEIHRAITDTVTAHCLAQGIELGEDNHEKVYAELKDSLQDLKTKLTAEAFAKYGELNVA